MMRKTLLSLGVAIALIVPTGAVVAGAQDDESQTTSEVAELSDQDRDQVRDCDLYDPDTTQVRDRDRDQVRDCDLYDPDTTQVRDRDCDRDPEAAKGHSGLGDGANDGTGPLHKGPADGTGSQFGPSGR